MPILCRHRLRDSTLNRIVDLTLPLNADVPVRPGDPGVVMDDLADIATEGYRLTHLSMGTHTGTHIDAPSHIIEYGDTLNNISFDVLVGPCCLVNVAGEPGASIALDDLIIHKEIIRSTGRVVLKSGWAKRWGTPEYYHNSPSITIEAARWLVGRDVHVKLVGFDMPTPSVKQETDIHKVFLEAGIPIVECLYLEKLTQSHFEIVVAPLPLRNREGAPCRVLGLLNRSS